jgi:calcineurin-like phosphoesterase family protein
MKVFFFSDPHFEHENMAIRRGFTNAKEHDEYIVDCWNSVVNRKDTVYCLGDITMEKARYDILLRLNGIINVVLGNHDQKQHTKAMLPYVNSVAGMIDYKSYILTHCPIHSSQLEHRYSHNIHGHVHGNSLTDHRYINVCAEVIDYRPKTIEELMEFRPKII